MREAPDKRMKPTLLSRVFVKVFFVFLSVSDTGWSRFASRKAGYAPIVTEDNMQAQKSPDSSATPGYTRRDLVRYVVRSVFGVAFFGVLLFWPAGELDWPMAWVYLGVFLLVTVVSAFTADPALLIEERGPGKEGRKNWDFILVSVYGIVTAFATPIVAGFDHRYGWSPAFNLTLQLIVLLVYLFGWGFHLWAMAANKFFSTVYRLQTERGHSVVGDGPYRYVRHPGYVGGILFNLGIPIILGSIWAMIPAGIGALLLVIRTALEDRTLQQELEGYQVYAERVRYRLLPGVW
jgi:protein-S-isoprenylcysteine O-methyltransferase Ste14